MRKMIDLYDLRGILIKQLIACDPSKGERLSKEDYIVNRILQTLCISLGDVAIEAVPRYAIDNYIADILNKRKEGDVATLTALKVFADEYRFWEKENE